MEGVQLRGVRGGELVKLWKGFSRKGRDEVCDGLGRNKS